MNFDEIARSQGGKTFDSFSGNWDFYLHNGYVPTKYAPWDHSYDKVMKEQGWDPKLDKPEPVIYFKYDPQVAKQMVSDKVSRRKWMNDNTDKMIQ